MLSIKTKIALVGAAALGLFMFGGGTASASGGGGGGGGAGPAPGPLPPVPRPTPAPTGQQATVIPNSLGGMVIRTEPSTRGGNATKLGLAPNGATVTVLGMGYADLDGTPGEWWQVSFQGITGYSRAIDRTTQPGTDIPNYQLLA